MGRMAIGLTVKAPPPPILSQLFAQQILLHSPKAKAEGVGWRQNSQELLKMTNSTKIKMKTSPGRWLTILPLAALPHKRQIREEPGLRHKMNSATNTALHHSNGKYVKPKCIRKLLLSI